MSGMKITFLLLIDTDCIGSCQSKITLETYSSTNIVATLKGRTVILVIMSRPSKITLFFYSYYISGCDVILTNIFQYQIHKVDTDNITISDQNVKFIDKSSIFYLMYISLLFILKFPFMAAMYHCLCVIRRV